MAIALNIPSQIEKYLSVAFFPATGNEFTLYIANDTNRLYQWNGAAYVEVSQQDAVNWGSIGGDIINQTDLQLAFAGKVDVEAGKGLSTNDYTTTEKNKLAGIEAGAQVNDVDSVNGYTGAVVLNKSDVGLSNVDNTSDLNKPISTATQNALNAKENTITAGTTSQYFRGDKTFQTLDKAAVGLGNVDNTSDLNKPISTATQSALNAKQDSLGFTPVPTSRTLTINGVTQDLSANRTFTISTGITIGSTAIASGSVGRILFEGAGNVVQESSSLFWNSTNNRLGIGTSSPNVPLEVFNSASDAWIRTTRGTNTIHAGLLLSPAGSWTASNALWNFGLYANTNDLRYWTYNGSTDTNVLNLFGSTANVGIGTTTDAGFRLDVNGTIRASLGQLLVGGGHYLEGLATSSTDATLRFRRTADNGWVRFTLGASSQFFMSGETGTGELRVGAASGHFLTLYSGGSERIRLFNSTGNIGINTTTDAGFRLDVNGTARVATTLFLSGTANDNGLYLGVTGASSGAFHLRAYNNTTMPGIEKVAGNNTPMDFYQRGQSANRYTFRFSCTDFNRGLSIGSGSAAFMSLTNFTWGQTNGDNLIGNSLEISPTINVTANNGTIIRGLYYNPTITSMTGVTHYAIHTVNGLVRFENLPTSSAGLPSGTLYNNLGVLMIA